MTPTSSAAQRCRVAVVFSAALAACLLMGLAPAAQAQVFDDVVVDIGNVGLTVTNAGFVGRANVRNNPQGPPSFEYPLDSGVEHLFEAGLWVGGRRHDGQITVRTGAITTSGGYAPGIGGFEIIPRTPMQERSSLPDRDAFSPLAISHQDFVGTFDDDTFNAIPPIPESDVVLGFDGEIRSYAWNFPFTEYFVVIEFEIANTSGQPWEDVHLGMWHDLVVRNVQTTTDVGTAYFNKGGSGFLGYPIYEAGTGNLLEAMPDSQLVTYSFNAGGAEESLNTYGSIVFLGAEWDDPLTGQRRFFHPSEADSYVADGYDAPRVNPRWWHFSGGQDQLARPQNDAERYERMATPYPNPVFYQTQEAYETARDNFFNRLRTDGQNNEGNWIGVISAGPIPRVDPGTSVTVTFGFVAALKPEQFQTLAGRPLDNQETRTILRNNVDWAIRTFEGDGETRYRIPEPPASPRVRAVAGDRRVSLYWDRTSEFSVDPITGLEDFQGYRIYQSQPGEDRLGDPLGSATLVAQFDSMLVRDTVIVNNPDGSTDTTVVTRNWEGYSTGFCPVRIQPEEADGFDVIQTPPCEACFSDEVVGDCRDMEQSNVEDRLYYTTFDDDDRRYYYRFDAENLLNGWQYAFAITAFDDGDPEVGLPSFESGRTATAMRVFPGTLPVAADDEHRPPVGVYPNPYRVQAAWDGESAQSRKLYFTNLPERAEIRVYTLSGQIIGEMDHDAATYQGEGGWFSQFSGSNRVMSGGEHAWDILSDARQRIATGLYFFTVRDLDTGDTQTGKFVVIK